MVSTVYKNYAKLRDKNHMSDYYVGKKANIPRAIFTYWRKGGKPNRGSVDKLAAFFGVPANYFYEGDDDEETEDCSCAS